MSKKGEACEPLDSVLESYLEYLLDVGRRKPDTVKDVRCTLKRVTTILSTSSPDRPLWRATLVDLLRWMEQERQLGASVASLHKYLSHVRGFLEYAWRSGRSDRNVLDGFRIQDRADRVEPASLSEEQARLLIMACPRESADERRDRTIVLLLYGCGLRTKELRELRIQDVNVEKKELFIRHGKGDRERVVPVPESVQVELLAYLLERGAKRGPLFRTAINRCPLQAREVSEVVRRAAKRAGLKFNVTPKTLRHSFATHLMDRGVDVAVISQLMGHRSPQETGVYLHVLPGRKERAVELLTRQSGGET